MASTSGLSQDCGKQILCFDCSGQYGLITAKVQHSSRKIKIKRGRAELVEKAM